PWGCAFELGKVVESWEKWRVMWRKPGKWSSGGKNAGGKRGDLGSFADDSAPWGCAFELGKVVESWEKWRVMWRKAGKWSSGGKNAGGKRGYWMNSASYLNGKE
nr:hypothetical protein [Tanacetum cinerariifolium]